MTSKKRPVPKLELLTPDSCKDFPKYYPNGTIKIAQYQEIHPEAMKRFEGLSRRFILPKDYHKGDFHQFFIVQKTNQEETHVAYQTKVYQQSTNTERLLHLYEIDQEGKKLGHGEIRFNVTAPDEFFVDKPFEGFTRTERDLQKKGRGTDRLLLCNALTKILFSLPYYSDTFSEGHIKESEGPWKRQLELGNVVKFPYKDRWRYCFK